MRDISSVLSSYVVEWGESLLCFAVYSHDDNLQYIPTNELKPSVMLVSYSEFRMRDMENWICRFIPPHRLSPPFANARMFYLCNAFLCVLS